MSDQSLFDQTPAEPQGTALDGLVGEGKKFKTAEDLAKGKLEADTFIEHMKQEQAQLREHLEAERVKFQSLEEKLDGLLKAQTQAPASTPASQQPTGSVETPDIAKLIKDELSAQSAASTAEANLKRSNQSVVDHFGGDMAKAKQAVQEKAQALGVTVDYLQEQAKTAPEMFLSVMGVKSKPSNPVMPNINSTVKDVPQNVTGPQPGTKAYFDHIRRTDPNLYFSASFQQEVYKAAAANPNDWR